MRRFLPILLLASFPWSWLCADTLNHVVFRNSVTAEADFYTGANSVAPSTLASQGGRLPVETKIFFTPPNALRLEWRSAPGGEWDAEIRAVRWPNRPTDFEGDTLLFWCYATQPLAASALPQILLEDQDGNFTGRVSLSDYLKDLIPGRWTEARIPLRAFASASVRPFSPPRLHSIFFVQGNADNQPHTLIVDEIRIDSDIAAAPRGEPSNLPAPRNVRAKGYERHVDISWSAQDTPDLAYYLIYRSTRGGPFVPVGVQMPQFHRYIDYVGSPGFRGTWKVAAVDERYRQSALSGPASASTRPFTDDDLLTMLEEACFRYYWEGGSHPVSGMALENAPGDPRLVATGATGLGIMAMVVAMDRGFITRQEGLERIARIVGFLEKVPRFHGAWPHFIDGATGKPMLWFGMWDDGGDLVETSYLMEGLLTARQYFDRPDPAERELRARITELWRGVEWDWYVRRPEKDALLWHWSPDWSFRIDHPVTGFNEAMITYLLAIASPTHPVPASLYYSGWAVQSPALIAFWNRRPSTAYLSHYENGHTYQSIRLDVGLGSGGPLFFTQYSFMGFDPHAMRDRFTDYFENNRNLALINYRYCQEDPKHYAGYGPGAWGLTSSFDPYGYKAHAPDLAHDNGTISPTGALGAFPYTPQKSMAALRYFYRTLGDRLWGIYGPRDAFNPTENWYASFYLGLDEASMVVMTENYRTGLVWKLFMSNPEISPMMQAIGFQAGSGAKTTAEVR